MTNFYINFGMTVTIISVDGHWTNPFNTTVFWLSVAQRLDVLLHVPENGFTDNNGLFVSALAESYDSSLQTGMIFYTTSTPPKDISRPFITDPTNAFMNFTYERLLSALVPLSVKQADRIVSLNLTGDNGFMSLNNHSYQLYPDVSPSVPNAYPIQVKLGERVHVIINNNNPDPHAMHLHGHVFQVIELDGEKINGALRDTVLIPGGCHTAVIAFDANNPGIHPFHCHMQFHMMAGMLTTVEYIV